MASYLDQLIQEFSMPDIAGQAGIDPMQALQVDQEPQGIDRLTALMRQQQDLQQRQREALSDYSALASKRPESRLLQENQTLGGFFKDPSEAQRQFMINAGLKLAMGDTTRDLSARLAESLGQGVGALQASRAAELKQEQAQAASQLKSLQLQGQQTKEQFDLQKEIVQETRLRDAARAKTTPTSPLLKIVKERNTLMAQGDPESIAAADILQQQINVLTTGELTKDDFKFFSDDFKGIRESARKTDNMLRSADRAELALANAETGFGSETILGLKKFANLFGVKAFKSDISDSEALQQVLGENVLDVLGSGDLGAGTGLSDKDVEFARQVAGGTIRLDEETIRYAIDAKRRAANFFRKQHNDALGVAAESFPGTTLAKGKPYDLVEFTPISEQGRVLAGMPEGSYKQSQQVPSRIATPYQGQSDDEFLKTLQGF